MQIRTPKRLTVELDLLLQCLYEDDDVALELDDLPGRLDLDGVHLRR